MNRIAMFVILSSWLVAGAARAETKPAASDGQERYPKDCNHLAELSPAERRYLLDEHHYRLSTPEVFPLVLHAVTGTFDRPRTATYPNVLVRLCITDLDYRMRYRMDAPTATVLAPPSIDIRKGDKAAGGTIAKGPPATDLDLEALDHQRFSGELAEANAAFKAPLEFNLPKSISGKPAPHAQPALFDRIDRLIDHTETDLAELKVGVAALPGRRAAAIRDVDEVADIVTGDVPVLQERAEQLRGILESSRAALEGIELRRRLATLDHEMAKIRALLFRVGERLQGSDAESKALQEALNEKQGGLDRLAGQRDALPSLAVPNGDVRQALAIANGLLDHFRVVDHNVFFIPTDKDHEYEIVVRADRVALAKREVQRATTNEKTDKERKKDDKTDKDKKDDKTDKDKKDDKTDKDKKDDKTEGDADGTEDKDPAAGEAGVQYTVKYLEGAGGQMRQKFQVRSLSWFRINLGLAWTSVRNPGYTLGTNDTGAQVITHGGDSGLTPMFVLSHYWCGVDIREWQPYHRFRRCGWANTFLPTFMIGIPFNKNPVENLFFGGMIQPIPGFAFLFGGHLGEVKVLRHGYVDGQPPPAVAGQAFNIEQAQEDRLRLGYFIGFAVTDSLFAPFFARIAGYNN